MQRRGDDVVLLRRHVQGDLSAVGARGLQHADGRRAVGVDRRHPRRGTSIITSTTSIPLSMATNSSPPLPSYIICFQLIDIEPRSIIRRSNSRNHPKGIAGDKDNLSGGEFAIFFFCFFIGEEENLRSIV